MNRRQFLERCANAYDVARATPEVLSILERWADMVMRLEAGQMDIFTHLWELEKDRLNNFYVKLANDAEGYRAVEFMAILTHPCQACATDPNAWWTRAGFCDHSDEERSGAVEPGYAVRQKLHASEWLSALEARVKASRRDSLSLKKSDVLDMLAYIGQLERRLEVREVAEPVRAGRDD